MKTTGLILLLTLFINLAFAQKDTKKVSKEFQKDFVEADDLMAENNYPAALIILLNLLEEDPDNANLLNKAGVCYMHTALEKDKAIKCFERALRNTAIEARPDVPSEQRASFEAYFNLGKAYHINYKFEDAIKLFNGYLDKIVEIQNNDSLVDKAEKQIQICNNAIELMKKPISMKVENLGKTVNSKYPEYSPFVNADESVMIFTSKREGSTGDKKTEDGNYFEDIYISAKDKEGKWGEAQNIGTNVNTAKHDASCGLSVDGTELFIYRDDGNIYSSKLIGNDWSVPQSLGTFVNTQYNEKGASMSSNGNFLFFESDRPGGYGGFDIYMSKKLPNRQWGEAYNLGPNVNTEYDEIGPFFHPDESTLFFASQGHNTMGGFDVYYTSVNIEDGTATPPTNIGYPINSTDDDVFLAVTPDGRRAYYSSYKKDGFGYTDLYMISLKEPINRSLTVLSGVTLKKDTKEASNISISVNETETETQEAIGNYTPNTKTGKYIFIVNAGKKYSATFEADGYTSENRELNVAKDSTYEQLNRVMKIDSVFLIKPTHSDILLFTKKSVDLNEDVKKNLQEAIEFLKNNKTASVKITFKSNTDSKLNKKRNENIIDFLVKNGIEKKTILVEGSDMKDKQICDLQVNEKDDANKDLTANNKLKNKNNESSDAENQDANTTNTKSNLDDIKKLDVGTTIVLNNVLFPINKAYLTKATYAELKKLLELMDKNPNMIIEISGHTDITGRAAFNNKLSNARAKGVADYLIMKGVSRNRVSYKGYGSSVPMVSNETDEGRRLNRRVDFKVVKN